MANEVSLDELWNSAPAARQVFACGDIAHFPAGAQRYLAHAIAPGTKLASAVRLRMHGEIKLREWLPFTAEEVIHWQRGFIWAASVRTHWFPIQGFDRLLDGAGSMRWKVFGVIPFMSASGPDITRSAIGRLQSESIWLPSVLCGKDVTWTARDPFDVAAQFTLRDETANLALTVDEHGRVRTAKLARWGNPEGGDHRYVAFGAFVDEEKTFVGYTVPARVRAGWFFGTDRFAPDGEFFRATIDAAQYK